MIFPLLFALAADPSPSLEAIVNLGRGTHPTAATATTTETTPSAASAASTSTSTSSMLPTSKALQTAPDTSFPWAAAGAMALLGGTAFSLWWRKRRTPGAMLRTLRVDDSLSMGKGRALVVAEVDGRRFLLSSCETGISLLADLGAARAPATAPAPAAGYGHGYFSSTSNPLAPPPADDAFALALEREMAPVSTTLSTTLSTHAHAPLPNVPTPPASRPVAAGNANVDVEGQEIQRRLRLLGQSGETRRAL